MLSLKPLDIAVLLKIIATESPGIATVGAQELALKPWTPASLAVSMYLNPSDVYAALQRAGKARLFDCNRKVVKIPALDEFVYHGLQYVFLANEGTLTRGMPTSLAAPPLVLTHFDEPDPPPIWSHPMGTKRGYSIEPLYKRAADAAAADSNFYELLALIDAVREGGPRVKSVAVLELKKRFKAYSDRVPLFMCTKFIAYKDRGKSEDKDLEDIVAIVDGRRELLGELRESSIEIREYVALCTGELLAGDFLEKLSWYLPQDRASAEREPLVMLRFGLMRDLSL